MLDFKEDFHIHCNYNDHSSADLTIENVIKRSEDLKLRTIAFTEHVRKTSNWTEKYLAEIDSLNHRRSVKIIKGFEAKILPDGTIDCPDRYLNNDYFIIASFHTKFDKEKWLELLYKAIQNPYVNVIGHIAPEPTFSLTDQEIKNIGEQIVLHNKIIELNAKYKRPPVKFIEIFKELNVKFHLGSDAHSLVEIGNFDKILNLINLIEESTV